MQINSTNNTNQRIVSPPSRIKEGAAQNTPDKKNLVETKQIEKQREITPEQTKSALETFNKIFQPTHLEFQMHHESGKYFVQIIDEKTKDVLKQIPSEEFLNLIAEAKENHGLLVDVRV